MKLTTFTFLKNTPLTDFMNTIHFESNTTRDSYMLSQGYFDKIEFPLPFNYIIDRLTLRIPMIKLGLVHTDLDGVNYGSFLYGFDNKRYYFFVDEITYVNDNVTEVNLIIDGIMTYCQGDVLYNYAKNVFIERQHLTPKTYNERLLYLTTNDDILATSTKRYVYQNAFIFDEFHVVFTCSYDLSADYSDEDDKPNIVTSQGQVYDNILSPLNLYVMSRNDFVIMMEKLKPYPWVTENIKRCIIFPSDILNDDDLETVVTKSQIFGLYKFKDNAVSNYLEFSTDNVNLTTQQLYDIHDLNRLQDRHLLRNEYTTIEFYDWSGQQVTYDPAFLPPDNGLQIKYRTCIGYHNEIAFFCEDYQSDISKEPIVNSDNKRLQRGTFLNNAIVMNNFDEVPVLVDSGALSWARSANQRELAESRTITNRAKTVVDSGSSLQDRFYNAVSILSNVSPSNLLGKFNDEYEFYRNQQAEFADRAIQTPSISNQTNNSSFSIANDIFGVTLKVASISDYEWNKVRKYYKSFGYQDFNDFSDLEPIDSMTVCNYVKFSGQWTIPNVNNTIMEQIRIICENGLRLWHRSYSEYPLDEDISQNVMKGV